MEKEIIIGIISGIVSITTSLGAVIITHRMNRKQADKSATPVVLMSEDMVKWLAEREQRSTAAATPKKLEGRNHKRARGRARATRQIGEESHFNVAPPRALPSLFPPVSPAIVNWWGSRASFITLEIFGVVAGFVLGHAQTLGIAAVVIFLLAYVVRLRGRALVLRAMLYAGAIANIYIGFALAHLLGG